MKQVKILFYEKKSLIILFFFIGSLFSESNSLFNSDDNQYYKNNQQYIYINSESHIILAFIKKLQQFASNEDEIKALKQLYYRLNEGYKTASKQILIDAFNEAALIINNNYTIIQDNQELMIFFDYFEQLFVAINSDVLSVKNKA